MTAPIWAEPIWSQEPGASSGSLMWLHGPRIGHCSTGFLGYQHGAGREVEQLGHESASIWDPSKWKVRILTTRLPCQTQQHSCLWEVIQFGFNRLSQNYLDRPKIVHLILDSQIQGPGTISKCSPCKCWIPCGYRLMSMMLHFLSNSVLVAWKCGRRWH